MKTRKKVASNGSLCELVACEFFNVGDKVQLHAAKGERETRIYKRRVVMAIPVSTI